MFICSQIKSHMIPSIFAQIPHALTMPSQIVAFARFSQELIYIFYYLLNPVMHGVKRKEDQDLDPFSQKRFQVDQQHMDLNDRERRLLLLSTIIRLCSLKHLNLLANRASLNTNGRERKWLFRLSPLSLTQTKKIYLSLGKKANKARNLENPNSSQKTF